MGVPLVRTRCNAVAVDGTDPLSEPVCAGADRVRVANPRRRYVSSPENAAANGVPGSWHAIHSVDVPGEARVRSVTVDGRSIALARCGGTLGALDNHCPHQGGPLGEGSIEKGLLRCPWHGYDYDPLTGEPPGDFADSVTSYPVQEAVDGVHVQLPARVEVDRTVADVL